MQWWFHYRPETVHRGLSPQFAFINLAALCSSSSNIHFLFLPPHTFVFPHPESISHFTLHSHQIQRCPASQETRTPPRFRALKCAA